MRLKELRTERNLTQHQLARLSGVSQAYISDLDLNRRTPTITVAIRLADALGVSLLELIGDTYTEQGKDGDNQNDATAG